MAALTLVVAIAPLVVAALQAKAPVASGPAATSEIVDTAEAIARAAALASIGAVVVGFYRLRHERIAADRADARSILAEGALELDRTKGALKRGPNEVSAFT